MLCSGRVFGLSTVGLWISLGALRMPKDREPLLRVPRGFSGDVSAVTQAADFALKCGCLSPWGRLWPGAR
jgi:hypothetical protein